MKLPLKSWLSNRFKKKEPRKEDRIREKLPVKVLNDDATGVTRDLSSAGVFFETDKHYEVGSAITITIDFESAPRARISCVGTIVRVEDRGSKVGVAVHVNAREPLVV
jgi:Tfp pilus assembly protein PilZ